MYHQESLSSIDFIVVDNNPRSSQGRTTKSFCEGVGVRYIDMPEPKGTSQTRNRVFQESFGKYTMCLDPHVFLAPSAIEHLLTYYTQNPDTRDLIQGPLVYDGYGNLSTHFDDVFRSEMHGTWGRDERASRPISLQKMLWRWSEAEKKPVQKAESLAWDNARQSPFEIDGQGLGLFTCKTDAWLGFNENFRGFGGEEMYIHEKYRRAGLKTVCLPTLLWWHRFARPSGVPYPLNAWNKVRNYVLGHLENELPLDRVYKHFVLGINDDGTPTRKGPDGRPLGGSVPKHEWDSLVEDPLRELPKNLMAPEKDKPKKGCGSCDKDDKNPPQSLDERYEYASKSPSDLNEHCEKLKELASQSSVVVDFSMRPEISTTALLAGQPGQLISVTAKANRIHHDLKKVKGKCDFKSVTGDSLSTDIPDNDLLFIDTVHTADHFYKELKKHAPRCRRWIVRHDTNIYGERGEDGQPGLMPALRRFLSEHPEWSVVYHAPNNYGLTVISRHKDDKPKLPSKIRMAANFMKALADHTITGARSTPEDEYKKRLAQCTVCEYRVDSNCSICGCILAEKAKWNEQECPIGKWKQEVKIEIDE